MRDGTVWRLGWWAPLPPALEPDDVVDPTVHGALLSAVADIKGGKVEYRVDRHGNLHVILGKTSFPARALAENYQVVLDEVLRAKPAAAKGRYIKSITVATSMGPGIKVDPSQTRNVVPAATSA